MDASMEMSLPTLARAFRDLRLLQASGLAEGLASSSSGSTSACFSHLAQFAINYHGQLFRLDAINQEWTIGPPTGTRYAEVPERYWDRIDRETQRIDSIFRASSDSLRNTIRVETLLAYYGLSCLDGLRSSFWMQQALIHASEIATLPKNIENLLDVFHRYLEGFGSDTPNEVHRFPERQPQYFYVEFDLAYRFALKQCVNADESVPGVFAPRFDVEFLERLFEGT